MEFVGAKLALFVGDQLALILRDKRDDILWPDHWDMPGGGREGCETAWQTATRETHEELGIDVSHLTPVWESATSALHLGGATAVFFVARAPAALAADIRLGDEGQAWKLVSLETYLTMPRTIPFQVSRLREYLEQGSGP